MIQQHDRAPHRITRGKHEQGKKHMRKSLTLALVTAGTIVLAGAPVAASAHTPTVTADCDVLTVNATAYEERPAVGEATIIIDNPDHVPAVPGTDAIGSPTLTVENPDYVPAVEAVPAVYATEHEYRHRILAWKTRWEAAGWNADGIESIGWYSTGNTREVLVTEAIPGSDAIGEPTIDIPNPDYVAAVPGVPAVGEPTLEVENPDHVPGDATPNQVTVVVDGEVLADAEFGTDYSATFELFPYEAHTYQVVIDAWNDPTGELGWSQVFSGTTTPCDVPVTPANPQASIAALCGEATVTLSNPQDPYTANLTASFVVEVDGVFWDAFTVNGGETDDWSLTFDEDTGSHTVEVFQAGTSAWASIASAVVDSDCAEAPTEPTPGPGTDEEPTPTVKPAFGPGVADDEPTGALAVTGGGDWIGWAVFGSAVLIAGVLALLVQAGATRARRQQGDID
jgi:hypothetical protein